MAKGGKRRAPVIRIRRRRRTTVRPTQNTPRRRHTQSAPSCVGEGAGAATSGDQRQQTHTRAMRAERRHLLQQLAETECRAKAAERERDDIERRANAAERERDDLLAEQSILYDEGTELWQNVWEQQDVSSVLTFPTMKSVVCDSIEACHHGNDMPGVYARGAIDNGRTTQSIWVKGAGYTMVGLVTCDDEKNALRRCVGSDWGKVPMMTNVFHSDNGESKGDVFTIEVDMMERRAELYVSSKDSSRRLEPEQVWEDLPDKVWVAVAFKRNTGREAVLMPCIHWNMRAA